MVDVKFERLNENTIVFDGCTCEIVLEQPHFSIYLDTIEQSIFLCEDCGNHLQNDMSDEYCKFVDLRK